MNLCSLRSEANKKYGTIGICNFLVDDSLNSVTT